MTWNGNHQAYPEMFLILALDLYSILLWEILRCHLKINISPYSRGTAQVDTKYLKIAFLHFLRDYCIFLPCIIYCSFTLVLYTYTYRTNRSTMSYAGIGQGDPATGVSGWVWQLWGSKTKNIYSPQGIAKEGPTSNKIPEEKDLIADFSPAGLSCGFDMRCGNMLHESEKWR